eukprot:2332724-Prymnesium_polylepis.2
MLIWDRDTLNRPFSASEANGFCGRHTKSIITATVQKRESRLASASMTSRKGSSRRICAPRRSG